MSRSAFLCHFAEHDEWVSKAATRRLGRDLATAGRPTTIHAYPGTSHWFFESDRADAFDAAAADLAWKRTVRFLKTNVPRAQK